VSRRSVAVRISGQEYRILSDADEVWLQTVANHVDSTMTQIRERTGTVDSLDVAVLTSLNLAKELLSLHDRAAQGVDASSEPAPEGLRRLIELVESAVESPLRGGSLARVGGETSDVVA
jgi:cell division protein ZapA (FtsZ GTPase activity inhibitor)